MHRAEVQDSKKAQGKDHLLHPQLPAQGWGRGDTPAASIQFWDQPPRVVRKETHQCWEQPLLPKKLQQKKPNQNKAANIEVLARGVRGKSRPGREVPASTFLGDKLLLPPLLLGWHDRSKLLLLLRQVIVILKGSIFPVHDPVPASEVYWARARRQAEGHRRL